MKVNFRFLCYDIPYRKKDGQANVPDGSTVEEALGIYLKAHDLKFDSVWLDESIFMINKKSAKLETRLSDNDDLLILRTMGGG